MSQGTNGNGSPEDRALAGLPPWMAKMRAAATNAITETDIAEIVQNQVKRAKAGDQNAIKFVFDQVLGGAQLKGATFIQNNFGGESPDKPTDAVPGTPAKLETIRRRVAAGMDSCRPEDRSNVNLD